MFDSGVDSETAGLEEFGNSDMKRGENFEFIDVESFVSIGEDIIRRRVIRVDETFIAYLRVRNFFLISRAFSLASNSRLFMQHVRYAPVASLRAEWETGSIIF